MIDPKDLEGFNAQLEELIGAKLRDSHLFCDGKEIRRFVIVFIKPNDSAKDSMYYLEIADCAWQILQGDSPLYTFLPNPDSAPKAQKLLEKLAEAIVTSFYFDTGDLSLLINLDNGFKLKLLHSKESNWQYSYVIEGYYTFYHTYDDTIGWGSIDYQ